MNYQLTARIQRKMPEFSKGQRLIANYIEEHYDEVAFTDVLARIESNVRNMLARLH